MATAEYTPSPFPCNIVVVQTTGRHGKTFKFERKNWCVLGANKDCDIIVPFPGVAQLQALIHVKRNGVFLQGIDKQNPVRHPRLKRELLDEEEVLILPGDIFLLGNREFLIEYSAEDVYIEANDGIAQSLSGGSSSSRKITPRLRRRRKSSIMVREFDETYVLPTNGSEKLLSNYQLARVSRSEAEIQPQQEEQPECEGEESLLCQNLCSDEQMCSQPSSSDDSAVLSSEEGSVSRTINFDPTNECPQERENRREEWVPATSAVRSKVASEQKQRRNLIFDRLSKGLPATPRRREKESALDQNGPHLLTTLKVTSSNTANIASGKENVPLHETLKDSDVKKDRDVPSSKDLENAHSIRSPLANRSELENQASPPTTRTWTPVHKGLPGSEKPGNLSAQTLRSRSVAFATTIELAPGSHYSPFRPRKMKTKSGSATRVKRHAKKVSEKVTRSMTRSGHPSIPTPSGQKEGHLSIQSASNSGPASNSQQFQQAKESQHLLTDKYHSEAKPVVEYEDDSNPPTPSSSEAENEAFQPPAISEPSPMARVGGALAGFLKRLSGNFESDQEDDSSSETDSEYAHKRLPFPEGLKESGKDSMSSEPVMSSVELHELSQTVPSERRRDFVNQVLSAANDVREVTNPVSPEHYASGHDSKTSSLQSLESDSTGVTTASESSDVSLEEAADQDTPKDNDGDDDSTNGSTGSEVHSSIGSGDNEGLRGSRSTSLEVSGSDRDIAELKMEILHTVNVNDDLNETDDEDAVERDYGDDPWDDLDGGEGNESDDREVTAVVLDDEVDIQNVSGLELTSALEKKIETEFEQLQLKNPRDEVEDSSHETHTENLDSSAQPPKDDGQHVSSHDKDSHMSEDVSAKDSASSLEKKTEDGRTAVALHLDEADASMKELSRLKKDELKKLLRQRGLDVEGLKKDLVERLARAMTLPATNSEVGENQSESESQDDEKSDEEMVDLTNLSEPSTCHVTPKRSAEKTPNPTPGRVRASTRRPTRQSLVAEQATAESLETPKTVPDAKCNAGSKNVSDISLYRRRTMRELRQFLKDRGVDTQLKMRKDELIQYLISHSIGSDGQVLGDSNISDDEKALPADTSNAKAKEKTLPKSSQKMTVAQIRALLREQGQCQTGTKKTLFERLTVQPERRTRSRRVLDVTSCTSCQEGKTCEAAAKS